MCSPSLLITCPYQINLLSAIFLEACATLVVPRMCSFLILYLRVTPHIHRSILISVTSIRFSCLFVVAHVSAPYSIAGLITVVYTFPFSSTGILLSHSTPLHFFQFLQQRDSVLNEKKSRPMTQHRSLWKTTGYLCWNRCKRVNRASLNSTRNI